MTSDSKLTSTKDCNVCNTYANQMLHHGDCLPFLQHLLESATLRAGIDLIYIDPPFNTGTAKSGDAGKYYDSWPDINQYIQFLRERVCLMHKLLNVTGSLLVHCDWRTAHHIRFLLDEIFGHEMFVNHLIWQYGLGGSSPRRFARKHDDIFLYSKTAAYYFDPPMVPATSRRMEGQYKKATDILDIPALNNMAHERNGYPTQKPLALLKILIGACCPPGGIVADFFCGSGTTLVAAAQMDNKRKIIGSDINREAIDIVLQRLTGAVVMHK